MLASRPYANDNRIKMAKSERIVTNTALLGFNRHHPKYQILIIKDCRTTYLILRKSMGGPI